VGVFAFGMYFYRLSLIEANFVDRNVFPASAAAFWLCVPFLQPMQRGPYFALFEFKQT
jgi:hypothetical protein